MHYFIVYTHNSPLMSNKKAFEYLRCQKLTKPSHYYLGVPKLIKHIVRIKMFSEKDITHCFGIKQLKNILESLTDPILDRFNLIKNKRVRKKAMSSFSYIYCKHEFF